MTFHKLGIGYVYDELLAEDWHMPIIWVTCVKKGRGRNKVLQDRPVYFSVAVMSWLWGSGLACSAPFTPLHSQSVLPHSCLHDWTLQYAAYTEQSSFLLPFLILVLLVQPRTIFISEFLATVNIKPFHRLFISISFFFCPPWDAG